LNIRSSSFTFYDVALLMRFLTWETVANLQLRGDLFASGTTIFRNEKLSLFFSPDQKPSNESKKRNPSWENPIVFLLKLCDRNHGLFTVFDVFGPGAIDAAGSSHQSVDSTCGITKYHSTELIGSHVTSDSALNRNDNKQRTRCS
jgi:hypothetical protein